MAILSANYIAARLGEHFPVLYTGEHGRVAHECIVDIRPITKATGVTVDDVAKRLVDYGFHAPTMSFPVAGTLMIEPTESESLAEIDRFCDAMIAIRGEIDRVASGEWAADDSPLAHAPHTAEDLLVDRLGPALQPRGGRVPGAGPAAAKYWPPVSRIDGGYGDRNLMCACPAPEAFELGQPLTRSATWASSGRGPATSSVVTHVSLPASHVVADLLRRADQVDVLDHRRGHRGGGIGLAAVEVRLLDLLALGLVAEPHEHVLVEVAVAVPPCRRCRAPGWARSRSAHSSTSSPGTTGTTHATSKSPAPWRAPGRAKPSPSAAR